MKAFVCPSCSVEVWFDSLACEHCATAIAYDLVADEFVALTSPCRNRESAERCNWQATADGRWCASCSLDVHDAAHELRRPFQLAKRRSLRQLARHGIEPGRRRPDLRFDLRASTPEAPVVTGHQDGLITLDTAEAEPSELESVRTALGEPYRTPLGHVRHELGHWWWATAIDDEIDRAAFRRQFGDERADYAAALESHYNSPDDGSWRDDHVSFYAASHPWEDFAESFAHVLHIDDTYETAAVRNVVEPAGIGDFEHLYARWVPFTLTLNEINRSMGTPDPYPFAVAPPAVDKFTTVAGSFPGSRANRDRR